MKVLEYQLDSLALRAAIEDSKFKGVARFGKLQKGHILLQDHGDQVWYRNIKIRREDNVGPAFGVRTSTVFLGIIGGGNISDTHARAAAPSPASPSPPSTVPILRRRDGSPNGSAAPVRRSRSTLAHRPMDLVAIGSPSALHVSRELPRSRVGCTSSPRSRSTSRRRESMRSSMPPTGRGQARGVLPGPVEAGRGPDEGAD